MKLLPAEKLKDRLSEFSISSILQFTLSIFITFTGAALLLTGSSLQIHKFLFVALGLVFVPSALRKLSGEDRRAGIYSFVFGILMLLMFFSPRILPDVIDIGYGIDLKLFEGLVLSLVLTFSGIIGTKLSLMNTGKIDKKSRQMFARAFLSYSVFIVIFALGIIIIFITFNGFSAIDLEFLTKDVRNMGVEGGVFPAIVGTLLLGLGTALVAVPLGVGTAIYLEEYASRNNRFVRLVDTSVNILNGTPSIVHGLFGLAVFVPVFGISLLSGFLTLGILTLPIVIRSSQEALRSVSDGLREGSLALGATKWQTIKGAVLPSAVPGIVTGTVLGLGRAFGETAPIMFTAVYFTGAGLPDGLTEPVHALSYHLLELTKLMGYKSVAGNAWGTALILLVIVLIMNFTGIIIRNKYRDGVAT